MNDFIDRVSGAVAGVLASAILLTVCGLMIAGSITVPAPVPEPGRVYVLPRNSGGSFLCDDEQIVAKGIGGAGTWDVTVDGIKWTVPGTSTAFHEGRAGTRVTIQPTKDKSPELGLMLYCGPRRTSGHFDDAPVPAPWLKAP